MLNVKSPLAALELALADTLTVLLTIVAPNVEVSAVLSVVATVAGVQGETGRLVDFFDVQGLANEVCSLLDNPQLCQRLGAQARAFACANCDLKTVCLLRQLA